MGVHGVQIAEALLQYAVIERLDVLVYHDRVLAAAPKRQPSSEVHARLAGALLVLAHAGPIDAWGPAD
eukprot:13003768-Alexandrium_andersonii.AAC.1